MAYGEAGERLQLCGWIKTGRLMIISEDFFSQGFENEGGTSTDNTDDSGSSRVGNDSVRHRPVVGV
jgi:hypothetical protein